jgi:hypothetical protein
MVTITGAVEYAGKYVSQQKRKGFDVVMSRWINISSHVNGVKIKRPIQAKQIE